MSTLFIILIFIAALLGMNILLFVINILQKGGSYRGESVGQILGKLAQSATADDILKLSKAQFMQLFYAAPAPSFREMKGEYRALNHPGGVLAGAVNVFTNNFFGPGRWMGKAFFPFKNDRGSGYNIFEGKKKGTGGQVKRARKMNTHVGRSAFDSKDSFLLDYGPYNRFLVHSMRDELRKINDTLYVGLGYMALGGGSINPSPFMITGPDREWAGADV